MTDHSQSISDSTSGSAAEICRGRSTMAVSNQKTALFVHTTVVAAKSIARYSIPHVGNILVGGYCGAIHRRHSRTPCVPRRRLHIFGETEILQIGASIVGRESASALRCCAVAAKFHIGNTSTNDSTSVEIAHRHQCDNGNGADAKQRLSDNHDRQRMCEFSDFIVRRRDTSARLHATDSVVSCAIACAKSRLSISVFAEIFQRSDYAIESVHGRPCHRRQPNNWRSSEYYRRRTRSACSADALFRLIVCNPCISAVGRIALGTVGLLFVVRTRLHSHIGQIIEQYTKVAPTIGVDISTKWRWHCQRRWWLGQWFRYTWLTTTIRLRCMSIRCDHGQWTWLFAWGHTDAERWQTFAANCEKCRCARRRRWSFAFAQQNMPQFDAVPSIGHFRLQVSGPVTDANSLWNWINRLIALFRLLYMSTFQPKFIRALWYTLPTQSSNSGFVSPLNLIAKGIQIREYLKHIVSTLWGNGN